MATGAPADVRFSISRSGGNLCRTKAAASRAGRLVAAALLCLAALAGCRGDQTAGRVLVLGLDGMDPGVIDLLMSEGRMPNFARLRQYGAYGRLRSMKPLLSPIIWTTVATGRLPSDHGIGHFTATNEKTGERIPVTSRMRQVKSLWNILSDAGRRVGVVGWWATWPAESVNGLIVSDHTCYHFLFDEGTSGATDRAGIVFPESATEEILSKVRRPGDVTESELARFVDVPSPEANVPFDFNDETSHFRWALATALSYAEIGLDIWANRRPDVAFVYIEGVDSTSHLFGHLFRGTGFAGELAEQHRRFGRAVEEMYLLADEIVGRYLDAIDDRTTLLVLSDHGFQLGALHGDPSKTRDMRRVSERFHRIEGILYMYGRGIKKNVRIDLPELVDIAPTVLRLAGLPAAADMPGRVLAEAFENPTETARVATYEREKEDPASIQAVAPVDPAILEHLEALGYLDTQSPSGDRNLAALHFEAGRYAEAAAAYRALVESDPEDGALRASLAGALGALGKIDEALEQLDEAVRLAPLHPESHHNRGVILERKGRTSEAIESYRTAVRYRPDYEPSRAALYRLTGTVSANRTALTETAKAASVLAERASQAAKRGDYAHADSLLDEAERIAPDYAMVHGYRANVAFLRGDSQAAIRALQEALRLEPDNALYLQNLRHLQRNSEPGREPAADESTKGTR
jgi:tetratricopeptide (TPR) repeat protein